MTDSAQMVEQRHIPRTPVTEVSYKRYGMATADSMMRVTCNIRMDEIVRPNPNRVSYVLVNNSSSVVYIGVDNKVSATLGIPLSPNGGTVSRDIQKDGHAVTNGLYGLSSVDGLQLTLFETYVVGG